MTQPTTLILSTNAGSSSLKIALLEQLQSGKPRKILASSISGISSPPAQFSFKSVDESGEHILVKDQAVDSIKDHASAFSYFIDYLYKKNNIESTHITHICHRVVHGGDYSEPVIINEESYHHIETLSDLAPLHNGAALAIIKSCIRSLPQSKSIAFFDTAFHATIPRHISSFAIDQEVALKKGLKKYGFHGISYSSILHSVADFYRKPKDSLNLIILHLGSGASACAIKSGKSLDTSMSLTPLDGLPGATRSGAIDPSLIFHYTNKAGKISHSPNVATQLHVTQAEEILNFKSGWKALTGTTDFGEISRQDNEASQLAFELFTDRVINFVGAYHLKLHGEVDALVFSGGIGEKAKELRKVIGSAVSCLGYRNVDNEKNDGVDSQEKVVIDISQTSGASTGRARQILVCRTDEELEMARQCIQQKI